MNKVFKGLEGKRETGEVWFDELKRKRNIGPAIVSKRYSEFNESTKSVHAGQYDDPNTNALGTPNFSMFNFHVE